VFIIGCEEGVFPHSRAVESGDLEEERRLCYVGITRAKRELYLSYARMRSLYGGRDWNLPSRFLDEIPAELTDRQEQESRRPRVFSTRWDSGEPASRPEPKPGASFSLGEDVVHASFGEGVVVGLEPGGIVVVRFAGDASERKLMADYAPLKKR
jgi:ATP-dependent DNA helicase UvrD/PcrA